MDLLRIRKSLGYSQAELAKKIGTSATKIGRIERGLSKPSPAIVNDVLRICEENGVDFVNKDTSFVAWHLSAMYELKY